MSDGQRSVNDISCPAIAAGVFEYLDGEMTSAAMAGVDAHLARCPACREHLDRERTFLRTLRSSMAGEKCPDIVRERIRDIMRRREARAG